MKTAYFPVSPDCEYWESTVNQAVDAVRAAAVQYRSERRGHDFHSGASATSHSGAVDISDVCGKLIKSMQRIGFAAPSASGNRSSCNCVGTAARHVDLPQQRALANHLRRQRAMRRKSRCERHCSVRRCCSVVVVTLSSFRHVVLVQLLTFELLH